MADYLAFFKYRVTKQSVALRDSEVAKISLISESKSVSSLCDAPFTADVVWPAPAEAFQLHVRL